VAFVAPHPPMPADRVRFVGEVVAMVIAETPAAARDGAERVEVAWTALPAVTASTAAAQPDAPLLYDGTASNVCVDTDIGDAAGVDLAFARAAHVVRLDTWAAERREAFMADYGGRDLTARAELALDREGNFLAFRGANTSNVGAHAVSFHPLNKGMALTATVYRVPVVSMHGRAVVTNTTPTTPYRSAGRPEVMFIMERLIDLAARRHGFDRLELRRQNLVPSTAMPYKNPMGLVYDSGDYQAAFDRAVELADWKGFEGRRAEARRRGRYRGIGVANYIELNTGFPRERAHITVQPDGYVDLVLGTLSSGQGHATSFAQLLVEWLGVDLAEVRLITGDTDVTVVGGGAHSARALRLAAVVMAKASDQIVDKGRRVAAWMLEAAVDDVEFSARRF